MLDRDAIIADTDRRNRARRHTRAEAERDLARRRRLMERIRPLVAEHLTAPQPVRRGPHA